MLVVGHPKVPPVAKEQAPQPSVSNERSHQQQKDIAVAGQQQQRAKVAALRTIFFQVAPHAGEARLPPSASAQDLAAALMQSYLVRSSALSRLMEGLKCLLVYLVHAVQLSELCGEDVIREASDTLTAMGDVKLELAPFLLYIG